ncbi:MAG TPA: stalk domain-containing protein, partial [Symbiobacteriaceae bacterium]|nr:stalk domain-containing protein [Symbiobacteriaceae bacterium]
MKNASQKGEPWVPEPFEEWVEDNAPYFPGCGEGCLAGKYQEYIQANVKARALGEANRQWAISMTHQAPKPPDPMSHTISYKPSGRKVCKLVASGTVKGVDQLQVLAAYIYPRPGAKVTVEGPDLHATRQPTAWVKVSLRTEQGWQWPSQTVLLEVEGPAVFAQNGQKRIEVTGPEARVQLASSQGTGRVTVKAVPKGFDLPPGTGSLNATGYQIPVSYRYIYPDSGDTVRLGAWLKDPNFQPVAGETLRFAAPKKGKIIGSADAVTDATGYAEVEYQLPADMPASGPVEAVSVKWVRYPDVAGTVTAYAGEPVGDPLIDSQPAPAPKPAAPPQVPPASHIRRGGCGGTTVGTVDEQRISLKAEPAKLDEKNNYTAKVTAQIVALPGRPAATGLPITLDVVPPGELKEIKQQADGVSATLTTTDKQDLEVMVRARSADGAVAFLIVPVGNVALRGDVVRRPGEGKDVPVVGAQVTAVSAGGKEYQNNTDSRGEYKMTLKAEEAMKVTVTAPGYLDARLKGATPATPNAFGWIQADPIYLVPRDLFDFTHRRGETVYALNKEMFFGSSTLLGLLGPAAPVADPLAPGASLDVWLNGIETNPERPAHTEEALRRMNLALEVALLAGTDAKTYADEVASAIWDDGLGMLMDLLNTVNGLSEVTKKQLPLAAPSSAEIMDNMLKTNLTPTRKSVEQRLADLIYTALGGTLGAEWTQERAEALIEHLTEKSIEQSRKTIEQHWKPEPGAQEAVVDMVTGKAGDVLSREAKGAISSLILKRYLEMLTTELDGALRRGVAGPDKGFTANQFAEAQRKVRANIALVRTTRELVGNTPGDEALKTFVEGSMKDYNAWGKLLISAVTLGRAVPVLKRVDIALDLGSAALKGYRFQKGMKLLDETLTPGSIWWQAVQRGIRQAFDDDRMPDGARPGQSGAAMAPAGAGKVSLFVGQARLVTAAGEKAIDAAPFLHQGRTLVPVRAAAEALGATVGWDPATQQISITRGDRRLV